MKNMQKYVKLVLMFINIEQFCKGFDKGADQMRKLSKEFCDLLAITMFGYVRIYHNGCISWLTSQPDQDRLLISSGALNEEPLVDTPKAIREGHYLHFNNRPFPGSESFYRERAKHFQVDHGLIVVRHQKEYLETCCFSGLLSKRPLYNLFINEKVLFSSFMEHFVRQLDKKLLLLLEDGLTLADLKKPFKQSSEKNHSISIKERQALVRACGWTPLLKLSKRERECLALFTKGYTYQVIGNLLKLSDRTVEHYMESVKNKLGIETRSELYLAGEKLSSLGL